jgi:rare lipoprotein A
VQVPASAAMPVVASAQSGIFLQVGAFSGTRNAEDLAARIRSQVPSLGNAVRVVDTDNLHKVHLGPYPNRESALSVAQQLQQTQLGVNPVVVVVR